MLQRNAFGVVRIDFSETWIDCTAVLSEFQDETSLTFVDWELAVFREYISYPAYRD